MGSTKKIRNIQNYAIGFNKKNRKYMKPSMRNNQNHKKIY